MASALPSPSYRAFDIVEAGNDPLVFEKALRTFRRLLRSQAKAGRGKPIRPVNCGLNAGCPCNSMAVKVPRDAVYDA